MELGSKIPQKIEDPIWWARLTTKVGAIGCWIWVVYLVGAAHGFLAAILAFAGLAIVYGLAVSLMLALAASFISFGYEAVGVWLPFMSYVLAAILVYADLTHRSLKRLEAAERATPES